MSRDRRTAVVTGASAGIGAVIGLEMARLGWRVALGARRHERLEAVASRARELGGEAFAGELDVTDADGVERFFDRSEQALGIADVIVCNAGISRPCRFEEMDPGQLRREIDTNLLGPMLTTRRALRALLPSGRPGDVVLMGSDAARHPRPFQLPYGATKAGLENFGEGLALEIEGTGVRVTRIRLGPTVSEFASSWDVRDEQLAQFAGEWARVGLRDGRLPGVMLAAEDVARTVIHAVTQPPGVLLDTIELQPAAPVAE